MSVADIASSAAEGGLLLDNAFQVLAVSVRDTVAQIVAAASDPLLDAPPEQIEKARLTLTNPRARLAAEVGWLPGVAPARARQLVEAVGADGRLDEIQAGLPPTARANLLIAALQRTIPETAEGAVTLLFLVLQADAAIETTDLLRDINEDRALAAIPPVRSVEAVEQALGAHRQSYVQVLRSFLDRLPSDTLVEAVTRLVEIETEEGRCAPGELLDRLLDAYEVETLGFLEPEAATIRSLADEIVVQGPKGEDHLRPAVAQLTDLLAAWDVVAQPLQLIRKAHGEGHALSRSLAAHVRSATVDMVNQHGLADLAAQINGALSRHFAEVADLRDVLEVDATTLEDIRQSAADRQRSEAAQAYAAKVGLGQTLLSIDARQVVWGGQAFSTDEVDRVRWGGTSHSVNGIPTGTTYLIAFGSGRRECEVNTRSEKVFREFTSRLWNTCGVSIAVRMLGRLSGGEQMRIGEIEFSDAGVVLKKSKFLAKAETRTFSWSEVKVWSDRGEFHVAAKADKHFQAKASYQSHANTHVLSNVISSAFDRGVTRLSALIE